MVGEVVHVIARVQTEGIHAHRADTREAGPGVRDDLTDESDPPRADGDRIRPFEAGTKEQGRRRASTPLREQQERC